MTDTLNTQPQAPGLPAGYDPNTGTVPNDATPAPSLPPVQTAPAPVAASAPAQTQPAPTPAPASSVPPPAGVAMLSPDGSTTGDIPLARATDAEAAGWKVSVDMTSPNGKVKARIPFENQDAAQKAGWTWDESPNNESTKQYMTRKQQESQDQQDALAQAEKLVASTPIPTNASEHAAASTGGEDGLNAYRQAQAIITAHKKMMTASGDDYVQAQQDFQDAVHAANPTFVDKIGQGLKAIFTQPSPAVGSDADNAARARELQQNPPAQIPSNMTLGQDLKEVGKGAVKGASKTVLNTATGLANTMFPGTELVTQPIESVAAPALTPSNSEQETGATIGSGAAQVGMAMAGEEVPGLVGESELSELPKVESPSIETTAANAAAKSGIAPGTPETVAPTGEDIQPNLQQSIRDHANATAKAARLEPVPDNVSVMDAEQNVADQATTRSKATFAKVEKATGINPTTFKNRISSLNDQIDSLAITDPERAGILEQQKIGYEATVNKAFTDAKTIDPSIDADQARADWNTSLRGDELSKAVRSSKSSIHTQAIPDLDPNKLTPKLQALNESQVSGAPAKLQQLPGGADNANSLVESAENARDATQQIKNFVPKSATGQQALSKIIADNTTAESGLTLRGVKTIAPTDWNGVVKDLGNLPADEARAVFGNDLAQVKQFAAKQAVKQNALDFIKLKTTGGKVTAGVGGTILEEAIRRH